MAQLFQVYGSGPDMPQYQEAKKIVSALRTVNNVAERGVKLISESDYSQILTKDKSQLQFILQTVEENRKTIPNMNKGTIVQALKKK